MEIPRFPRQIEILNLENFYRTRLSQRTDIRSAVAVPLLSYMGWPNDQTAREESARMLKSWMEQSEDGPLPTGMTEIQRRWARVADVVHLQYDLHHGRHQQKRGGSSIGKAIFLFSKIARSKGTGRASGWKAWSNYKDVAHLVAAAILVGADLKTRHQERSLGLELQQMGPIRVTLNMPELIIAVGLEFQKYGLSYTPSGATEPMFDPETLWRIPADINVRPLMPPIRNIRDHDLAVLNARRAGNRGKAGRTKTTPVC